MSNNPPKESLMPEYDDFSVDSILSEYQGAVPPAPPAPTPEPAPAHGAPAPEEITERARQMVMDALNDTLRMQQDGGLPPENHPASFIVRSRSGWTPKMPDFDMPPAPPVSKENPADIAADYNSHRRDKSTFIQLDTEPMDFMKDSSSDDLPDFDPIAESSMTGLRSRRRGKSSHSTRRSGALGLDDIIPAPIDEDELAEMRRMSDTPHKRNKAAEKAPVPATEKTAAPTAEKRPASTGDNNSAGKAKNSPPPAQQTRNERKSARREALKQEKHERRERAAAARQQQEELRKQAEESRRAAAAAKAAQAEKAATAKKIEAEKKAEKSRRNPPAAVTPVKPVPPKPAPAAEKVTPPTPISDRGTVPADETSKDTERKKSARTDAEKTAPAAPDTKKPVHTREKPKMSEAPVEAKNTAGEKSAARTVTKDQPTGKSAEKAEPSAPRQPSAFSQGMQSIAVLMTMLFGRRKLRAEEAAKWPDPPPPDDIPEPAADRAARYYASQVKPLQFRTRVCLLLSLIPLWISLKLPTSGMLGQSTALQAGVCLVALLAVMMAALDIISAGVRQWIALRPETEAMAVLTAVLCCLDAVLTMAGITEELPYCAAGCFVLTAALWGERLRCSALQKTFHTIASTKTPQVITSEHDDTLDVNMLLHSERIPERIVLQSERADAARAVYTRAAPILLIVCVVLSLASCLGGQWRYFFHVISAFVSVCVPFCVFCCFSLPFASGIGKMQQAGCAVIGYDGCRTMEKTRYVVVKDDDIFPLGTMRFSEINIASGSFVNHVVGCTASVIGQAGLGLSTLFDDLMERRGFAPVDVTGLKKHEGGGLTGYVGTEEIMVGSVAFMNLNGIRLPQEIDPHYSVCTAINNELTAVFTIEYIPVFSVQNALTAQQNSKTQAIFAIRDFNISPLMIRDLFKLNTANFYFPSFLDRDRLAGRRAAESAPICAVLARPGMQAIMEAAESGRRLYRATRLNTIITAVSIVLELFLMFIMCRTATFDNAAAMLLTMGFWAVITFFLSWLPNHSQSR